jgi:hypothetical protein
MKAYPRPQNQIEKSLRPEYSPPWLGRPYVLTDESLGWGRYVITDSTLSKTPKEKRRDLESIIKQTEPGRLASAFEHLLYVYCPSSFPDFLRGNMHGKGRRYEE